VTSLLDWIEIIAETQMEVIQFGVTLPIKKQDGNIAIQDLIDNQC